MRSKHCSTWILMRNMKKTHCRTWILARNLKNIENETQTLYDLEYGEKTEKREK